MKGLVVCSVIGIGKMKRDIKGEGTGDNIRSVME